LGFYLGGLSNRVCVPRLNSDGYYDCVVAFTFSRDFDVTVTLALSARGAYSTETEHKMSPADPAISRFYLDL